MGSRAGRRGKEAVLFLCCLAGLALLCSSDEVLGSALLSLLLKVRGRSPMSDLLGGLFRAQPPHTLCLSPVLHPLSWASSRRMRRVPSIRVTTSSFSGVLPLTPSLCVPCQQALSEARPWARRGTEPGGSQDGLAVVCSLLELRVRGWMRRRASDYNDCDEGRVRAGSGGGESMMIVDTCI